MSVLGTGVGAGVAQSGLQAQQVAGESDRKKSQLSENARRVRETFEAHLHSLEDPEKVEPVDHLQIEGHVPSDQDSTGTKRDGDQEDVQPLADDEAVDDGPVVTDLADAPSSGGDSPLYRHLDVKG